MGSSVSETTDRKVKLRLQEFRREVKGIEMRAHLQWGRSGNTLGAMVDMARDELRSLAELLVELRKVDRSRELLPLGRSSEEWRIYAIETYGMSATYATSVLSEAADRMAQNTPQTATVFVSRLAERIEEPRTWMLIALDDQHVAQRIELRDRIVRWVKNALFAGAGFLAHTVVQHFLKP